MPNITHALSYTLSATDDANGLTSIDIEDLISIDSNVSLYNRYWLAAAGVTPLPLPTLGQVINIAYVKNLSTDGDAIGVALSTPGGGVGVQVFILPPQGAFFYMCPPSDLRVGAFGVMSPGLQGIQVASSNVTTGSPIAFYLGN